MSESRTIQFCGKPLKIKLSPAANKALQQRNTPLHVEMELYFSCMIRKKVRFYEQPTHTEFTPAEQNLNLGFRPVMTQRCSLHETDGPPPLTDFPIANPDSFIPHWISLDFHKGQWLGEFGYD